jgi:hypothetical protein
LMKLHFGPKVFGVVLIYIMGKRQLHHLYLKLFWFYNTKNR